MKLRKVILQAIFLIVVVLGFSYPVMGNENGPTAEVYGSLEFDGTETTEGSHEKTIFVSSTFTVELWIRITGSTGYMERLEVTITWDSDHIELLSVEPHPPDGWYERSGYPQVDIDHYTTIIDRDATDPPSIKKWLTLTFHCLREGSSKINIADYYVGFYFEAYSQGATVNQRQPRVHDVSSSVGGVMESINKLFILAPYLALFGLIAAVTTTAVILKKRRRL